MQPTISSSAVVVGRLSSRSGDNSVLALSQAQIVGDGPAREGFSRIGRTAVVRDGNPTISPLICS